MKLQLATRVKAFISSNPFGVWFDELTDEEKGLKGKTVWELAMIIEDADAGVEAKRNKIVAEHMLNSRLARIQANAAWGSGVLGFLGGIVGGLLSAWVTGGFSF